MTVSVLALSPQVMAGVPGDREGYAANCARGPALRAFLVETRLTQWNTVRILPSLPMEDAMRQIEEGTSLF